MEAPTSEQIRTEVENAKKQYLKKYGEEAAAIDCHSHSAFSLTLRGFEGSDGGASMEELFRSAKERGLDGLLLTDHDNFGHIESVLEAAEREGIYTLPAIEVSSKDGHIIGIFPKELTNRHVKDRFNRIIGDRSFPDVSAEETIDYIHALNGVAVAAHPYFETVGLGKKKFRKLKDRFDGMEQFDGTATGLADIGSSDAHTLNGIGAGFTLIPKRYLYDGGLLNAIREKKCESYRTPYYDGLGDYDLTNVSLNRFVRAAGFTSLMGGMLYRNRRGRRVEEDMLYDRLKFIYTRLKDVFSSALKKA